MMPRLSLMLTFCVLCCIPCSAFQVGSKVRIATLGQFAHLNSPLFRHVNQPDTSHQRPVLANTALKMYNLPPSGGGGGGGGGNVREILTSVATLAAIVAFFASPLGAIFFAVLNSFFVLSLLVPVILWVGFQGWQFFNTVEGPCPQCGAPVRVLKEEISPSICLNCGTFVQVTPDKSSVDFYREGDQVIVDEDYTVSVWDSLLSGPMGVRSAPTSPQDRQAKFRREQTIIDVEINDKD